MHRIIDQKTQEINVVIIRNNIGLKIMLVKWMKDKESDILRDWHILVILLSGDWLVIELAFQQVSHRLEPSHIMYLKSVCINLY